jgi:hypothetical protein
MVKRRSEEQQAAEHVVAVYGEVHQVVTGLWPDRAEVADVRELLRWLHGSQRGVYPELAADASWAHVGTFAGQVLGFAAGEWVGDGPQPEPRALWYLADPARRFRRFHEQMRRWRHRCDQEAERAQQRQVVQQTAQADDERAQSRTRRFIDELASAGLDAPRSAEEALRVVRRLRGLRPAGGAHDPASSRPPPPSCA